MKAELTKTQRKILDYLVREIRESGGTPSLRAAARAMNTSHTAVAQTLKALENKAYIRRHGRYSRTIHILDAGRGRPVRSRGRGRIPVIGRITAGTPIYAQQEWEEDLLVDDALFPGPGLFALRVEGDSMKDAGILDRDLAVCTPRQYAADREIVVALIRHEEATVKRFFLHSGHIELRPENPDYAPRTYAFDDVLIQGKVIGVIRGPGKWSETA